MGKKNTKVAVPSADAKPAKKPRKADDPNKVKLPWNEWQLKRLARIMKLTTRLAKILMNANVPSVPAGKIADAGECFKSLLEDLTSPEAVAYKPKVQRGKPQIGSVIAVKNDEETMAAAVFTRIDPKTSKPYLFADMFTNAVVIGDERTAWMVQCFDGAVRLISKKLVALATK